MSSTHEFDEALQGLRASKLLRLRRVVEPAVRPLDLSPDNEHLRGTTPR